MLSICFKNKMAVFDFVHPQFITLVYIGFEDADLLNYFVRNMRLLNRISLYWKCQIIWWGLVSLFWLYVSLHDHQAPVFLALLNYFLDVAFCIGLTHSYKVLAVKYNWGAKEIPKLLLILILSVLLLAFSFMIIANVKYYLFWIHFSDNDFGFFNILLYWNPVLITGLRLMSIWLLAYHLYGYHKRELQISKLNAQLVATAKQAQLDNLSTQLNPHFLFNCMNSIKSLIIENPTSARRSIDLLSDILRSSLDQKENDLVPLKEELELVRDYFELEKIRYEKRLVYSIVTDPILETFRIPKFSIQLLAENAIKHGVDKFIEGGTITISIAAKKELVHIRVTNPGSIGPNYNSGIGLKNLKERLRIQYDKKASFTLEETNNNAVVATISIPKTK